MYLAISWKVVPYNCHDILNVVTSLELMKKKTDYNGLVNSKKNGRECLI